MLTYNNFNEYRLIEILINSIQHDKLSQVPKECFHTVIRHLDKLHPITGDIIECGVWKGGFSIFLSHLFLNKKIWVCDSFEGFQPPEKSKYPKYKNEIFTPDNGQDWVKVSLEDVRLNFEVYRLSEAIKTERIKFLKGFVKDTLPICEKIEKIALLRIDVDSYSATREVLDSLYPKVVSGGMIIFDDSCLYQTLDAIKDYFQSNNIPLKLYHPENDAIIVNTQTKSPDWGPHITQNFQYPIGCYTIK